MQQVGERHSLKKKEIFLTNISIGIVVGMHNVPFHYQDNNDVSNISSVHSLSRCQMDSEYLGIVNKC